MTEKTIHKGRNVKRIREMLGVKQDDLASDFVLAKYVGADANISMGIQGISQRAEA